MLWPAPVREFRPGRRCPHAYDHIRLAILYKGCIIPILESYGCLDPLSPFPDLEKRVDAIHGSDDAEEVAEGVRHFIKGHQQLESRPAV